MPIRQVCAKSTRFANGFVEMGAVNPNAIEDYTRVRERYDNLVLQREDLTAAGNDLQIVINGLYLV